MVLPPERESIDKPLHAATEGAQYLWTGLSVELHRDDAESYYFNIVSDTPRVAGLQLDIAQYPSVSMLEPYSDWSDFENLLLDCRSRHSC